MGASGVAGNVSAPGSAGTLAAKSDDNQRVAKQTLWQADEKREPLPNARVEMQQASRWVGLTPGVQRGGGAAAAAPRQAKVDERREQLPTDWLQAEELHVPNGMLVLSAGQQQHA